MCEDCHRTEAKDYWRTCVSFLKERTNLNVNGFLIYYYLLQVQVRQRVTNKKTFYYLEQLILKHKAHEHTLGIKPVHGKYCAS